MKRILPFALLAVALGGCGKKDSDNNKPAGPVVDHSIVIKCTAVGTNGMGTSAEFYAKKGTDDERGLWSKTFTEVRPLNENEGVYTSADKLRVVLYVNSVTQTNGAHLPTGAVVTARIMVDGTERGSCQITSATTTFGYAGRLSSSVTLDLGSL